MPRFLIILFFSLCPLNSFSMNYHDRHWCRAESPFLTTPQTKPVKTKINPVDPEIKRQFDEGRTELVAYGFSQLPKKGKAKSKGVNDVDAAQSKALALRLPRVVQDRIMAYADSSSTFFNLLNKKDKRRLLACVIERAPRLVPVVSQFKMADSETSYLNERFKKRKAYFASLAAQCKKADEEQSNVGPDGDKSTVERDSYQRILAGLQIRSQYGRAVADVSPDQKPYIVGICGVWSFRNQTSALRLHTGVYNRVDNLDDYLALAYPNVEINRCGDNEFICVQHSNGKKEWVFNKKNIAAFRSEFERLWQHGKALNGHSVFSDKDLASLPSFIQEQIKNNFNLKRQEQNNRGQNLPFLFGCATGVVPPLALLTLPYMAVNSLAYLLSPSPNQNQGLDVLEGGYVEQSKVDKRNRNALASGLKAFGVGMGTGIVAKTTTLLMTGKTK